MNVWHDMLGLIPLIFIFLGAMAIFVYKKKDISLANFTWGCGAALIALYTLATTLSCNQLKIILAILVLASTCAEILKYMYHVAYSQKPWTLYLYAFFITYTSYILITTPCSASRPLLATILICLWASRMLAHLYGRYTGKDPRFITWRQLEGVNALAMHVVYIFGLQLVLMIIMATPIFLINTRSGSGLNLLDYVGLLLWIAGMFFESIGDYQLFEFMKDPAHAGRLMRFGLWRYSRHPNYFGEVLLWWGIFLIALSVPDGWMAVIAPCTITVLLLFVTGIPWAERVLAQNPEFPDYKKRTSIFIPWLPKK